METVLENGLLHTGQKFALMGHVASSHITKVLGFFRPNCTDHVFSNMNNVKGHVIMLLDRLESGVYIIFLDQNGQSTGKTETIQIFEHLEHRYPCL